MIDRLTIAVCFPRPMFATSETEEDARALVDVCRAHGHDAEIVTLPGDARSPDVDAVDALRWALVDLCGNDACRVVDVVVCMHPSALFIRHSAKVAWVSASTVASTEDRTRRALQLGRHVVVSRSGRATLGGAIEEVLGAIQATAGSASR